MSDTTCPRCGSSGTLRYDFSETSYKCSDKECRKTYEVHHAECSHSGCSSWADVEGLCHFHANQQGIWADEDHKPFYPDE